jgi:hypothetical protein
VVCGSSSRRVVTEQLGKEDGDFLTKKASSTRGMDTAMVMPTIPVH